MSFSKTPPTAPGFYAWKESEQWLDSECNVTYISEIRFKCKNYPHIGLWCRLVPASELKAAFNEGASANSYKTNPDYWNTSYAKQIAEGKL